MQSETDLPPLSMTLLHALFCHIMHSSRPVYYVHCIRTDMYRIGNVSDI